MTDSKPRKGISPLIAAVLLIAFTMAVATIAGPWMTSLLQDVQQGTGQQAIDVQRASELGLEIMSVEFNRGSNELEVVVQNTGEAINNKTNVSIGVLGGGGAKTEQYDIELSPREITTLNLSVDRTYPLETLQVGMTNYPVSRESGIKCTPTKGLVGYWTFNEEQTENGWAIDISGYGNNGSLNKGVGDTVESRVGEGYRLDGEDEWVEISDSGGELEVDSEVSMIAWVNRREVEDLIPLGNNDEYQFWFYDNGQAQFGAFNKSSDLKLSGRGSLPGNQWKMISGIVRKDSGSKRVEFWVGSELKSDSQHDFEIDERDTYLGLGRAGGWQATYFDGVMDEVRIYNRSLSQSEIKRLYQVRSESWAVDACKLAG